MMEGSIKGTLENASGFKAGIDFGLAFSPFQIRSETRPENNTNRERIVAAVDKASSDAASTVLEAISKNGVRKAANVKLAEASVLFDATKRDVDAALASELALFCEKVGVDYLEARILMDANSDPENGLRTFAYESLQEEPYSLLEDAENLNLKLRISSAARETNEEMAKHAVDLTKDALRSCGKTMRRARISLLGISRMPNARSPPRRIVKELAAILEARGARIGFYDPYFLDSEPTEMQHHFYKSLTEAAEGKDCLLILAEHEQLKHLNLKKLKVVMKMPAAIVDLMGIVEPQNAEKEGFIYRGFGRGVWTK
jgi:UDP-N-acetyl-D-mannosaminuronic acid dehydrogenase